MADLKNREQWLTDAADRLSRLLDEVGETVPPFRVSVGFPGGRAKKAITLGQCWPTTTAADGVGQVFISPMWADDTVDILGTLLHEMIHVVDDCQSGHRGEFVRIARALGYLPKFTSSQNRSPGLSEILQGIARDLGDFPSAALVVGERRAADGPQRTYMLKLTCPNGTGYSVRTTKKHIEAHGEPYCACCQAPMEQEEK